MKTGILPQSLIEVLLEQHARIEELFQLVETSKGKAKREAFDELASLLLAHEAAEAEIVHPLAATSIDAGVDVVNERVNEEEEARELLEELMETGPGGAGFDDDFQRLRMAVLEHAVHEERYEFKHLRAVQTPEALLELGERFRRAQAKHMRG